VLCQSPLHIDLCSRVRPLTCQAGPPTEETAVTLRDGLHCQKCRHSVHALLWKEALSDFHGRVRVRRLSHETENGRNAQDVERAHTWFHRHTACIRPRRSATHRECAGESESERSTGSARKGKTARPTTTSTRYTYASRYVCPAFKWGTSSARPVSRRLSTSVYTVSGRSDAPILSASIWLVAVHPATTYVGIRTPHPWRGWLWHGVPGRSQHRCIE
jgi:hypothetical protein